MSTCSTATLSSYLDLTPQRLNQLHKDGWLVKADHNKWDTLKSIRGYIKFLRQRADKYASGGISLDDAKLRRWKADAETMELKLMLAKGEVVDVDFAVNMLTSILDTLQTQLANMTSRVTPLLLGQTEYQIVEKILNDAIHKIQTDIANADIAEHLRRMGLDSKVAAGLAELEAQSQRRHPDLGGEEPQIDA